MASPGPAERASAADVTSLINDASAERALADVADTDTPAPVDLTAAAFFDVDNTLVQGSSMVHFGRGLAARNYFTYRDVIGFVYAQATGRLYVNLYAAGEAAIELDGGATVRLAQQTDYPWDGCVRLTVTPETPAEFALCLRIPGWALGRPVPGDLYRFASPKVPPVALKVCGRAAAAAPRDDGYVHLKRRWQPGDVVETYADIAESQADFGYRPSTTIEEGLPRFVAWYRDFYKV